MLDPDGPGSGTSRLPAASWPASQIALLNQDRGSRRLDGEGRISYSSAPPPGRGRVGCQGVPPACWPQGATWPSIVFGKGQELSHTRPSSPRGRGLQTHEGKVFTSSSGPPPPGLLLPLYLTRKVLGVNHVQVVQNEGQIAGEPLYAPPLTICLPFIYKCGDR